MTDGVEDISCGKVKPKTLDVKEEERIYLTERRRYMEGEAQACATFDRYVFGISAAALGLSMTVLRDVVGDEGPQQWWSIVTAWSLFSAALISTLLSFRFSASAWKRECDIMEAAFMTSASIKDATGANWNTRVVRSLNLLSAISMVGGIVALLIFVVSNSWR